jgi:predicted DNA-binding protein with PD1-like motif
MEDRGMKILESKTGRVVLARLSEDEDLLEAITLRAKQAKISAGFFTLIGALEKAKIGFYHEQEYKPIEISEPVEIASCIGNISVKKEEELIVHAHIVISNKRGEAFGGHLLPGCVVSVNAELVLVEAADLRLHRIFDEETKLYLWDT